MPPDADPPQPSPDFDRHFRRAVWFGYALFALIACIVHANKAAEDRTSIVRWRHQLDHLFEGTTIYSKYYFPNPPIFPIMIYPISYLSPVQTAVVWFGLKAALAAACVLACIRMAWAPTRPLVSTAQLAIVLIALRPILSDLHHGNNNLLILSLIVGGLYAWRKGLDVLGGLSLALAICIKITPALFLPYFAWKRQWRLLMAATVGMFVFTAVVPSVVLGPMSNYRCLKTWWGNMLSPYVEDGVVSKQEVNQSMVGVLSRVLTEAGEAKYHGYGVQLNEAGLNLAAWSPSAVGRLTKGLSVALVLALGFLCRTPTARRDDPRLLGEFSLVVLTMLFVSERSWKHHYVTMLLPVAYLACRAAMPSTSRRDRWLLIGALGLAAALMATTSSELGWLIPGVKDGQRVAKGYKVAQFYGMFLWSGVALYAATAWRVVAERRQGAERLAIPGPHRARVDALAPSLARGRQNLPG